MKPKLTAELYLESKISILFVKYEIKVDLVSCILNNQFPAFLDKSILQEQNKINIFISQCRNVLLIAKEQYVFFNILFIFYLKFCFVS